MGIIKVDLLPCFLSYIVNIHAMLLLIGIGKHTFIRRYVINNDKPTASINCHLLIIFELTTKIITCWNDGNIIR